jgi:hypothetical protein
MQAYVIKTWSVNESPDSKGNYIDIKGRTPGLISWLLALVGIEPTISVTVNDKMFICESGSWSGRFYKAIPLSKLSSIYYGYSKPWKESLFLFFILGIVLGIPTYGIMTIVGGIIALLYYFLNKTMTIGVFEIGGMLNGISIKRSVIENKALDEKDAEKFEKVLLALVEKYN